MSIITYGFRVNKIFKNCSATAYFKPCEIVSAIVNLMDAKNCLTEEEYFFVQVVFFTYKQMTNKLLLNKKGFISLSNEIIAHLDLIAPYYKFCGNSKMAIAMLRDEDKNDYRQRAKVLLKEKAIFKEAWIELQQEFLKKFYK